MKTATDFIAFSDLTDDEREEALHLIRDTWDEIASDVFTCRRECGERGPIPRAEVIEVVLDGGRCREKVKKAKYPRLATFFGFAVAQFDEQYKAALAALPQKDWL